MKCTAKIGVWVVVFLLTGLAAAGCGTVPYTGRQQLLMVSENQELALGYQTFQQIKYRSRPSQDPALNERVREVGQRLARAVGRPDFRWEFAVIDDPRNANAFCLPGGKVGIYTGLFRYLRSDADLATVMSHEAAHVLARHAGERLSQSMLAQAGGMGLGLAMMGANPYAGQTAMAGYNLGTQMGVLLPYSRKQESEADRIGLILMAKAGYDPALGVDFWRRFAYEKRDKMQMPGFLSSHPSDTDRVQALTAALPEARRHYVVQTEGPPGPGPDWSAHQNQPQGPPRH